MADYSTITNAQVQPKAPVTSELMNALRDNPTAIAEGASGAPKSAPEGFDGRLKPLAVDGSGSANGASPIVVDLGSTRLGIFDIRYIFSLSGTSGEDGSILLEGSSDASTYTLIDTESWSLPSNNPLGVSKTLEFNQPNDGDTVYRYYRVNATGDANVSFTATVTVTRWGGVTP